MCRSELIARLGRMQQGTALKTFSPTRTEFLPRAEGAPQRLVYRLFRDLRVGGHTTLGHTPAHIDTQVLVNEKSRC